MSDPRDQPHIISRDPEAHEKLDSILEWIQGDQMAGVPGMAAEHRRHGERLDEHHDRLDRHSRRLHALEERGTEQIRWTVRTFAERAIGALAAGVVGAIAALFAAKPPHP
jgi:hypothetical protein